MALSYTEDDLRLMWMAGNHAIDWRQVYAYCKFEKVARYDSLDPVIPNGSHKIKLMFEMVPYSLVVCCNGVQATLSHPDWLAWLDYRDEVLQDMCHVMHLWPQSDPDFPFPAAWVVFAKIAPRPEALTRAEVMRLKDKWPERIKPTVEQYRALLDSVKRVRSASGLVFRLEHAGLPYWPERIRPFYSDLMWFIHIAARRDLMPPKDDTTPHPTRVWCAANIAGWTETVNQPY